MDKRKKLVNLALTAVVSSGLAVASTQAVAASHTQMEKCYGVAKAGMNDCGGPGTGHSCHGQAKTSGDKNEWLYLPKGTCDKLVNGSTTPGGQDSQNGNS